MATTETQPRALAVGVADSLLRRYPDPQAWRQAWGEILQMEGIVAAHLLTGDRRYLEYAQRWLDHYIDRGIVIDRRWPYITSFGPAAPALAVYEAAGLERYLATAELTYEYVIREATKLPNGAVHIVSGSDLCAIDSLYYLAGPFARLGTLTGDKHFFAEATRQCLAFAAALQEPETGLYFHGIDGRGNRHAGERWGRGNGWAIMASVQVLRDLPSHHADHAALVAVLRQQIAGLLPLQAASGLWNTVVDHPETYVEGSAGSMIGYGLLLATRIGLLPEGQAAAAAAAARRAWRGLCELVTADGVVTGTSAGTGARDFEQYATRPTGEYTWGTGTFLLFACALASEATSGGSESPVGSPA